MRFGLRYWIARSNTQSGLQLGNPAEGIDDEVRIGWARRIWSEARPAAGTLVARYLRSRGIMVEPPPTLRFATALKHPSGRYFPAMVAAVQSMDAQIVGIQRTYLKSDGSGKAAVDPSKLSLGVCAGGCVRLAQADDVVVLAEGVETALSVMQATGLAAWSTLGTSGLKAVRLPDSIRRVFIAADGDLAGKTASYDAARHLLSEDPKRQVKLVTPPSADSDWNDLLRGAPI